MESFDKILDKKINFEIGPRRDGDIKNDYCDSQKFKKYFHETKFNDIKYIIKTAIDWEKKIK